MLFYVIELMSSTKVLCRGNDRPNLRHYNVGMVARSPGWYLREWLRFKGVTQQWVADELNVQKSMVSRKTTGMTPYDREDIIAIARLLELEPFELLMAPADAMEIRQLRKSIALAAEKRLALTPDP